MPDDLKFAADFRHHLEFERSLSRNTVLAYWRDTLHFLNYCKKKSADPLKASPKFLDDYLWQIKNFAKLSGKSIFRKMQSLKAFYRFLILEDKIKSDPTRLFKSPHFERKLPDCLNLEEIKRLLDYPASDFRHFRTSVIAELFYACGLRITELINLNLENINTEECWILAFGKGGRERAVPVHKRALEKTKRYLSMRRDFFEGKQTESYVFLNKFGRKMSRVQVWKDIKELARLAGIKRRVHPHLFRHSFASHLLSGGADLRSLQEMLGHADLSTTQIYTHIDKTDLKQKHSKFHPRG